MTVTKLASLFEHFSSIGSAAEDAQSKISEAQGETERIVPSVLDAFAPVFARIETAQAALDHYLDELDELDEEVAAAKEQRDTVLIKI